MNDLRKKFNPRDSGLIFSIAIVIFLIVSFVVQYIGDFGNSINEYFSKSEVFNYVASFLIQGSFIALAVMFCKITKVNFVEAVGLKKVYNKRNMFFSIAIGVFMLFALYLPVSYFMELLSYSGYKSSSGGINVDTVLDLILSTLIIAVLPAIGEELLFRGIILQGLRRFGDVFAIIVSSVFFMLMHQNPDQTFYPLLSGIVMGFVFVKTGNILFSMVIHFFNNFTNVIIDFFSNTFSITYDALFLGLGLFDIILISVGIVVFVISLVYFIKLKKEPYEFGSHPKIIIQDYRYMLANHGQIFNLNPNNIIGVEAVKSDEFDPFRLNEQPSVVNTETTAGITAENSIETTTQNSAESSAQKTNDTKEGKYVFDRRLQAYIMHGVDSDEVITPPMFKDVSKNSFFNKFYTTKIGFFVYSLFGISVSIVVWTAAFLMGMGRL